MWKKTDKHIGKIMRKQFIKTVESLMKEDKKIVLLLGDIGVFGFRNCFKDYPNRTYNIGILEQSMVSVAAGLSLTNFIPIVHTITPFMIDRAFEQLKLDFCYQKLNGNFVGVGSSYDYASLGSTHHCPEDVGILMNLPNMQIVVPGTSKEFDTLFHQSYNNGFPTFFRLSDYKNSFDNIVNFGEANLIKNTGDVSIIVTGNILDMVIEATKDLSVKIIYYTTLKPFDFEILHSLNSNKFLICEPFYEGSLSTKIMKAVYPKPIVIDYIGMPLIFSNKYGTKEEHDKEYGFTVQNIKEKIEKLIKL